MRIIRTVFTALAFVLAGASAVAEADLRLESERDRALYAIGTVVGKGLKGLDLSPEEFARVAAGLRDAALSQPIQASPYDHQAEIQALQAERTQRAIDKDAQGSQGYLDAIESQEGVTKTESGLLYQSLSPGTGPSPGPRDRVRVHYEGRLRSGEVFDGTRLRETAAIFPLETVIACWTEGLQKMQVGGRARIVCPPALAYGDSGYPPHVPPNSLLDFEVELIEIER
jgi:FKBP-type peptidyl-prolyl cis-trans isomerase